MWFASWFRRGTDADARAQYASGKDLRRYGDVREGAIGFFHVTTGGTETARQRLFLVGTKDGADSWREALIETIQEDDGRQVRRFRQPLFDSIWRGDEVIEPTTP